MNKRRDSFVVRVNAPSDTVPYHFFFFAEKNELSLSVSKRLISLFSKNMARFETEEQAKEFLASVKQKPLWKYSIDKVFESN
ncbi:MAG: hypothetical protein ACXV8Q_00245 [Methylobacter sp.]